MQKSVYDSQVERIQKLKEQLALEEDKLNVIKLQRFPVKTNVYVHGCEDTMYEKGIKLGLNKPQVETFCRTAYELSLTVEIQEDGSAMLTHVDGIALVEPTEI